MYGAPALQEQSKYGRAVVGRFLHPLGSAACLAGGALSVRSPLGQRDSFREACASQELLVALGANLGDWVSVFAPSASLSSSSSSAPPPSNKEPCWVRLVAAGEGAVVCPLPLSRRGPELPSLHLPAGLIEHLGAAPGRTVVSVARWEQGAEPPEAGRVVVSRVRSPYSEGRCEEALRSFFHVPRVLRKGEVFSVPVQGLPMKLRELEDVSGVVEADRLGLGAVSEDDVSPALPSEVAAQSNADPLHGFAFCRVFSFRVEAIEARAGKASADCRGRCFRVSSELGTEVLLEGSSQGRGLPYITSHLFCQAPSPLPLSLQGHCERLLGVLAPAVRGWLQPARSRASVEALPSVLVVGARGCGKRVLWRSVCDRLGLHLFEVNCSQLAAEGPHAAEEALGRLCREAAAASPAVLCLRRLKALASGGPSTSPAALLLQQRRLEEALAGFLREAREADGLKGQRPPLLLLAGTSEELDDLSGPLRQAFHVELSVQRPDEAARRAAIDRLLAVYGDAKLPLPDAKEEPVIATKEVQDGDGADEDSLGGFMAKLTAGLSYSDLRSVCSELAMKCSSRGSPSSVAQPKELECIEQAVKRLQGGSKVAVTLASKVQWADVGGLQDAKDEIMNCITLPLTQGKMFEGQKARSGVLLFGPPGTGKTLLAKAVATECRVHFLSVKGPELLSMYIGESEKNVRTLFQSARELAPCVLFFDELDSLAPARGRGSDSGGVMDRVVSQLVTELDSIPATVFLVGATNRPDLLDRSLLRPGRLDRMVYLGIAKDKLPLLCAIARKFDLDEPVGSEPFTSSSSLPVAKPEAALAAKVSPLLLAVAQACPANLTGADVSVLCADAYGVAQREYIALLH
ncbi:unnamed protein product, partial [Polarella glacialis]